MYARLDNSKIQFRIRLSNKKPSNVVVHVLGGGPNFSGVQTMPSVSTKINQVNPVALCPFANLYRNSVEYRNWKKMIKRCTAKRGTPEYQLYAAKGISVYQPWFSFEKFLEDMGPRVEGQILTREDETKNYCPSNCVWARREFQN